MTVVEFPRSMSPAVLSAYEGLRPYLFDALDQVVREGGVTGYLEMVSVLKGVLSGYLAGRCQEEREHLLEVVDLVIGTVTEE